jgi:hypothetical protein
MHVADHPARRRLGAALDTLSVTFHGLTAHPDEHNCDCHWGSSEELSLLKTPDVELEPDLLRRTWQATDWSDHAAVLRRILPQFARVLVAGQADPLFGLEEAGHSFARGRWQQWPDGHADPVREFLHAWWEQSLTDQDAAVPAHQVFAMCAEASGTLGPWLADWEKQTGHPSDRRLAEAVAEWEYELLGDSLPWRVCLVRARRGGDASRTGRLAPRPRCGAAPRVGRTGGSAAPDTPARTHRGDRWTDPHRPGHRY